MASNTRKTIMDSFLRLLEARPVNKISVKDIVEDCGINRNTFYYHFADIPALAEAIVQMEADDFARTVTRLDTLQDCVMAAIRHGKKHKRAIWHIYHSGSHEVYEHYLLEMCERAAAIYVDSVLGDRSLPERDRSAIVEGYKCEIFGFVTDWLNREMSEDLEREFLRLCDLREGSFELMYERALNDE